MGKLIELKNKNAFRIVAKTETHAEITIYAPIGNYYYEDCVSAISFAKELKELPESITEITVRLNSPGGDVFDGIVIYNRLKAHKAKVTVYVDAIAASIASIILMAADEIIMSEGSQIMIHKPMSGAWGNSIELQELIDRLDDIEEQMLSIYQRRTGIDRSELRTMLAAETWIDAETALELGFADRAMEEEEQIKVAACNLEHCDWIKNKAAVKAPTQVEIISQKIRETANKYQDFLKK